MAEANNLVEISLWEDPMAKSIFSTRAEDGYMVPGRCIHLGDVSNTTWANLVNTIKDSLFNQHDVDEDLDEDQHKYTLKHR